MTAIQRVHSIVFGLLAVAATASAQTPLVAYSANMWDRGTTLNVFGGSADMPREGGSGRAAGAAVGWELTPRFTLEGSGTWFNWGNDVHAAAVTVTAQGALLSPGRYVPFLAGGLGLYHASFDRLDPAMPLFYHRRMMDSSYGPGMTATFTDPTLVGGAGINVFMNRHWAIRPEVMANVVLRNSEWFAVTTAVVRLGYHFEDHPVTSRAHAAKTP